MLDHVQLNHRKENHEFREQLTVHITSSKYILCINMLTRYELFYFNFTNAVCFILYNLHTGPTAVLHEGQCVDRYMCMNPMWDGSAGKKHLTPRSRRILIPRIQKEEEENLLFKLSSDLDRI